MRECQLIHKQWSVAWQICGLPIHGLLCPLNQNVGLLWKKVHTHYFCCCFFCSLPFLQGAQDSSQGISLPFILITKYKFNPHSQTHLPYLGSDVTWAICFIPTSHPSEKSGKKVEIGIFVSVPQSYMTLCHFCGPCKTLPQLCFFDLQLPDFGSCHHSRNHSKLVTTSLL